MHHVSLWIVLAGNFKGNRTFVEHVSPLAADYVASGFPHAEDIHWRKEDEFLVASLFVDRYYHEILFSLDGQWLQTVKYLDPEDLPGLIEVYLFEFYPDVAVPDQVSLVDTFDHKNYRVLMSSEEMKIDLWFDLTGKIIKTQFYQF